jgi:hypothetical protein
MSAASPSFVSAERFTFGGNYLRALFSLCLGLFSHCALHALW